MSRSDAAIRSADVSPQRLPRSARGIVGFTFVLLAVSNVYGFYFLPVVVTAHTDLGTASAAAIASAAGLFSLSSAATMPVAGRLLSRIPVRWLALAASGLVALAVLVLGYADGPVPLSVGFIVLGIGMVGTGPVVYTAFMVQRFPSSPDRPIGIVMTGLSVGGVILTPLLTLAIDSFGFRAIAPFVAVFHLVAIGLPAAIWLRAPRQGAAALARRPATEAMADGVPVVDDVLSLPAPIARRTSHRVVALAALIAVLVLVTQVPASVQLLNLAEERAPEVTHLVVPALAASAVVLRILVVTLLPRISAARLLIVSGVVQTVALLLLSVAMDGWVILAAVVMFGFAIGNAPAALPVLVLDLVGARNYPRDYSIVSAVVAVASALSIAGFGALVAEVGFTVPIAVTALLSATGIIALWRVR